MKTYRGKGGRLAKDKTFALGSNLPGRVAFAKAEGPDGISVSRSGQVLVGKGLKKGVHTAVVEATSGDCPNGEAITVTVKVK